MTKKKDKFVKANPDTEGETNLYTQNSVPKNIIEGVIGMALTEVYKSFGALAGHYGDAATMKVKLGVRSTKATVMIAQDELSNIWVTTREMKDATLNAKHRYAKYRSLQFLHDVEQIKDELKSARYKSSPVLVKALQLCTTAVAEIGEVMRQKDNKLALDELKTMKDFIRDHRGAP